MTNDKCNDCNICTRDIKCYIICHIFYQFHFEQSDFVTFNNDDYIPKNSDFASQSQCFFVFS